jgi:hypothetical protein
VLHHAELLGDLEPLEEQSIEDVEVLLAEAGDGVVVGVPVRGEPPEGEVLEGGPLNLPRRTEPIA